MPTSIKAIKESLEAVTSLLDPSFKNWQPTLGQASKKR